MYCLVGNFVIVLLEFTVTHQIFVNKIILSLKLILCLQFEVSLLNVFFSRRYGSETVIEKWSAVVLVVITRQQYMCVIFEMAMAYRSALLYMYLHHEAIILHTLNKKVERSTVWRVKKLI